MTRLQSLLKAFEEGAFVELLNGNKVSARRQKVIAQMQARFDLGTVAESVGKMWAGRG